MARLKIPTPIIPLPPGADPEVGGYDQDKPSVDGYVNVVSALLAGNKDHYLNFVQGDEDERADILQSLARGEGITSNNYPNISVFHEYIDIDDGNKEKFEKINSENSRIKVERDKRKKKKSNADKPSRYTVSVPENRPGEKLVYLHEYAFAIYELYKAWDRPQLPSDPAEKKNRPELIKARQFMFGMMLLTRCR